MEIKICGIRRGEDIEIINKYKPDYIGFVFAPSKRYVSPEKAAELLLRLNRDTKIAGVFVNEKSETVREIAGTLKLDAIQLHGDEDEDYIAGLNISCDIWKAVRIKDGGSIPDIKGADKILLDKYTENEYGGSGIAFDWYSVKSRKISKPLILAGGLNADNVGRGIDIFKPVCVDVSSAVETDGVKDENKIKEFIEKVREIENEQNR